MALIPIGVDGVETRLHVLENTVGELNSEIVEQHVAISRLEDATLKHRDDESALEAEAEKAAFAEQELNACLRSELAAIEQVRHSNCGLLSERRTLLAEIEQQKLAIGQHTVAANESKLVQAKCRDFSKKAAKRTNVLRKSLRKAGDLHAALTAQEAEEQRSRREFRCSVREHLKNIADTCAALSRRLGNRGAELDALRGRLEAARDNERRVSQEAAELRREARRLEGVDAPAYASQREELQLQLRTLTAADEQLREALRQARERLLKKQLQKEKATNPSKQEGASGDDPSKQGGA